MNVASKELCQELYELSGWDDTERVWSFSFEAKQATRRGKSWHVARRHKLATATVPAFDLGYLRQAISTKLNIIDLSNPYMRELAEALIKGEDQTVMLAIELFKQGILKAEN